MHTASPEKLLIAGSLYENISSRLSRASASDGVRTIVEQLEVFPPLSIQRIHESNDAQLFVSSLRRVVKILDIKIIAPGVELEEQKVHLLIVSKIN